MTTSYEKSIRLQKLAGTYDRNLHIKELRGCGFTFKAIGLRYNLSKQRIEQIVTNPFDTQTHQNEHRGGFIARLKEWVSKLFHTDISIGG